MKRLQEILSKIDGKGYKAYKDIQGTYTFPEFKLMIDAVQGDPFATPSKIRISVIRNQSIFKPHWSTKRSQKVMCEDIIIRSVHRAIRKMGTRVKGTGKSGLIEIDNPGQEIIERTACELNENEIIICLSVGLPAQGRRILATQAEKMFYNDIPKILKQSIFSLTKHDIQENVQLIDQQDAIRSFIKQNDIVAFIANGSILVRESGISDKPLGVDKVIPFKSPKSLEVEIPIPHRDHPIKGMALRKGINLIVGGGFHGKSTLLKAIELGVYNHIKGDGREYVITDETAMKIRSEDGRSVINDDISPFINNLPFEQDTTRFSTSNASGSTSQAANIVEALEIDSKLLIMDEDTCATNFMVRDARMQALVNKQSEPITPFLNKIEALYHLKGVSTILVIGGTGDYFDVADTVIKMENYIPYDVTHEAKSIAESMSSQRELEGADDFGNVQSRTIRQESFNSKKGKKSMIKTRGIHTIEIGASTIDLSYVEQLVDTSQTRMIAEIMSFIEREDFATKALTLSELLESINNKIDQQGLASFSFHKGHPGELARPRIFEMAAAINRLRQLKVE